jgi:N6-L-threonylcarbamoyladenine synthase
MKESKQLVYDFSGFHSAVQRILDARPDMAPDERRLLAQQSMRLLFEHLGSRLFLSLKAEPALRAGFETLVVSGGVASNKFLIHVLRSILDVRGYEHVEIVAPPPPLCTDNAAMIAWTGMEMFEAGYETDLSVQAIRKWPIDPRSDGGGILGASGWLKRGRV